jgi:hypothetical protein
MGAIGFWDAVFFGRSGTKGERFVEIFLGLEVEAELTHGIF